MLRRGLTRLPGPDRIQSLSLDRQAYDRRSSTYRLWSLTGAARFFRMRIFSISTVTEKAMEK